LAKRKTNGAGKTQSARKTTGKRTGKSKAPGDAPAATDSAKAASTGPEEAVATDRRRSKDRRQTPDRRKKNAPVAVERRKVERRVKVNRRRQIDPTTCERDYTADEIEFMNAMDEYKRASGRMFPTCSEVLEVIRKLGYEKRPPEGVPEVPAEDLEPTPVSAAQE